ncbi:MAG: RsmG family class I SAM-dependent methyltransferase [Alkalispirochaeta sp.]
MLSHEMIAAVLTHLSIGRSSAEGVAPVMARYVDELHRGNDRFGLISREDAADPERLLSRHILDSIAPWRIVADLMGESGGRCLFDLGSGAGLPGIPLGYVLTAERPEVMDELMLVERRSKRVAFLLGVLPGLRCASSGVAPPKIRALESDTGDLPSREGERDRLTSATVVFRAYQQTSEALLAELSRVFGHATPVCALKGKAEQARTELNLLRQSRYAERSELHTLVVPGETAERSVLTWYTAGDNPRAV